MLLWEADVTEVVDRTLPSCLGVGGNPVVKLTRPADVPAPMRIDPREQWAFVVESITKRLRTAGVSPDYVSGVDRRAWQLIWQGVTEYEERQGEEHPVRAWERGEVMPSPSAS